MKRLLGFLVALTAVTGVAHAGSGGADLKAALVRCADVAYPAALAACGDDPLQSGRLEVNKHGDVAAVLVGAEPNTAYDVVLHSTNGSTPSTLAVLATDALGNASNRWPAVFDQGQAGIVAFTLGTNASVEFVAGFSPKQELEADLIPCAAVNTPAALGSCGADTLKSGSAEVGDGDVKVEVSGALPAVQYTAVFRSLDGATDAALGVLTTDKKGKGSLRLQDLVPEDAVGAGNVVLQRDGLDQFITGFQSDRKRPPHMARFHVGLLRCADVNTVAALTGCGADQLKKGDAIVDDKGDVNLHVMGAVARSTYEVVFVGTDGATEVPIGTFTTNPAGNGHLIARDAFPSGTRGVGLVVVRRDGVDQFVTGFSVSR